MTPINNKVFAKIVAGMCVFLEFSGDQMVNPDAAMQAMEQISAGLRELEERRRLEFISLFEEISKDYDGEIAGFVSGLGEALGLAE
jgi:hypothetical protein